MFSSHDVGPGGGRVRQMVSEPSHWVKPRFCQQGNTNNPSRKQKCAGPRTTTHGPAKLASRSLKKYKQLSHCDMTSWLVLPGILILAGCDEKIISRPDTRLRRAAGSPLINFTSIHTTFRLRVFFQKKQKR